MWCRVSAQGTIIERWISECNYLKGRFTAIEPHKSVCVCCEVLRGCDKGVVTCVHQRRCRVGLPIYLMHTHGCLIRQQAWTFPFVWELWLGCCHIVALTHEHVQISPKAFFKWLIWFCLCSQWTWPEPYWWLERPLTTGNTVPRRFSWWFWLWFVPSQLV